MKTPEEIARRRTIYSLGSDYWKCPITRRILQGSDHDDKALCGCGQTNPAVLLRSPKFDETGGILGGMAHHIKRFLAPATVDEFLDQRDADDTKRENEEFEASRRKPCNPETHSDE